MGPAEGTSKLTMSFLCQPVQFFPPHRLGFFFFSTQSKIGCFGACQSDLLLVSVYLWLALTSLLPPSPLFTSCYLLFPSLHSLPSHPIPIPPLFCIFFHLFCFPILIPVSNRPPPPLIFFFPILLGWTFPFCIS